MNEHNALVPRDHWLDASEKEAIIAFHAKHSDEGYRRLTYMMMDTDVVAVSPATVYRVLKRAGCFERRNRAESGKGKGFQQPLQPHEHWHVDISVPQKRRERWEFGLPQSACRSRLQTTMSGCD